MPFDPCDAPGKRPGSGRSLLLASGAALALVLAPALGGGAK